MDNAMLFERLPEPYLVLDGEFAPVAANAAWRARFADREATRDAGCAFRVELDPPHLDLVRSVARNLAAGQERVSRIVTLSARPSALGGNVHPRNWRVLASFVPATAAAAACVTLRYDDVTGRLVEPERPSPDDKPGSCIEERTDAAEHALGSAGLGIWTFDAATEHLQCSERCLLDLGAERASDMTAQRLLGGSSEQAAANLGELKRGRRIEHELMPSASGAPRWVLIRAIGQFGMDGAMRSVTGFTLDITARKARELELHALASQERSERERSDALARTMDQFIASVSHELRSPLNAIVSWAELLKLASSPSHVERAGEAIRRNGRQLSHMVDDLLDSGAIATGKLSVVLQPVDLGALAAIVAEDVTKLAQHKNLQLHTPDVASCIVMADESRMMQVIWNLLTNAVKFTDEGRIELSVKVSGDHAELCVRDTGRGIDPDALSLLFDRFQQIAPQSSGRISGLGLGLWLTRHIVNLHNGTIVATSDGRGLGSTFTVRVPLAFPFDS